MFVLPNIHAEKGITKIITLDITAIRHFLCQIHDFGCHILSFKQIKEELLHVVGHLFIFQCEIDFSEIFCAERWWQSLLFGLVIF